MKVTYILVTYNRLNLLRKVLNSALSMTKKFDKIIVINNNSNDGTKEFLQEFKKDNSSVIVINCENNLGGSGGFSLGIEVALKETPDNWLFLADDDAIPDSNMLSELEKNYQNLQNKDKISVICTSVINCGNFDLNHRKRIKIQKNRISNFGVPESEYSKPFYLDAATFVGFMIKAELVNKIGLPVKDLFIYYDDTEYSLRASKYGNIICFPTAKIYHDTNLRANTGVSWRDFYNIRNYLFTINKYFNKSVVNKEFRRIKFRKTSIVAKLVKHRTKEELALFRTALYDGMNNILGKHEIYAPGWKPNQK